MHQSSAVTKSQIYFILQQYQSSPAPISIQAEFTSCAWFCLYQQSYNTGELYMEYLKKDCERSTGERCWYCVEHDWFSPVTGRIPQPMPDRPGHFRHVNFNENGEPQQPDDLLPRANLKTLFNNGTTITIADQDKISEFCERFCVQEQCGKNCKVSEIRT